MPEISPKRPDRDLPHVLGLTRDGLAGRTAGFRAEAYADPRATFVSYAMISPPVPYRAIDALGWFEAPFAHLWNFHDVPTIGALLLLGVITFQWLALEPLREDAQHTVVTPDVII